LGLVAWFTLQIEHAFTNVLNALMRRQQRDLLALHASSAHGSRRHDQAVDREAIVAF
jgi:hypothetical protein